MFLKMTRFHHPKHLTVLWDGASSTSRFGRISFTGISEYSICEMCILLSTSVQAYAYYEIRYTIQCRSFMIVQLSLDRYIYVRNRFLTNPAYLIGQCYLDRQNWPIGRRTRKELRISCHRIGPYAYAQLYAPACGMRIQMYSVVCKCPTWYAASAHAIPQRHPWDL